MGYFDCAVQWGICGCRFVLQMDDRWSLRGMMVGGVGTNNIAEILSLWIFLSFALIHGVTDLKVFGDSKLIIDWLTSKEKVNNTVLFNGSKGFWIAIDLLQGSPFNTFSES